MRLLPDKKAQARDLALIVPSNNCGALIDSMPATNYDGDSVERPTILGLQHVNPYLIANMQQAYNNLGLSSITATVTNQYVRFLPNSPDQLAALDSIMDVQGLDLFEEPMDYDITVEGDYYQDPSIPIEQVTYQYAVVPASFQFPVGIAYTVLAQVHIPGDDYTAVETEAERLASLQDCNNSALASGPQILQPPTCPRCYVWSASQNKCVPYTCPTGYVCDDGGTGGCILSGPPPPNPPPPAPDAAIPAGNITVSDVNLGTKPGVRNLRVVVKRWFKIQRLYTDNNGHFTATKKFKHKVKVVVKFKNSYADIKGVRGIRFWQMYLPIAKTLGVYSGDKSNIPYNFQQYLNGGNYTNNKGNKYWVAATVHNAVQEQRDYATQLSFSPPPTGLTIMLTNWSISQGLSSCPLFKKRSIASGVTNDFITVFIGNGGAITPFNIPNIDIVMDYHIDNVGTSSTKFSSDHIKETLYHELSHASQYSQAGKTWYTQFFTAEAAEMGHYMLSPSLRPYGDGTSLNSPMIGLGESWGYFMGFYLANLKYNVEPGSTKGDCCLAVQDNGFVSNDGIALENFNPNLSSDKFHWIPKGLMLDLIDIGEPTATTKVNDQVSGYTIQQIFGALQSDITSISQYKARLLQQNQSNPTNIYINPLFVSYGY